MVQWQPEGAVAEYFKRMNRKMRDHFQFYDFFIGRAGINKIDNYYLCKINWKFGFLFKSVFLHPR